VKIDRLFFPLRETVFHAEAKKAKLAKKRREK
jgi:hypothetical protein